MSRLTGTDILDLKEAYQEIYSPQELTEEQVWEEVEIWVNSLMEEGYDLSDYTWDDLYEYYLNEVYGKGKIDPVDSAGFVKDAVGHENSARNYKDAGLLMSPLDRAKAREKSLRRRDDPKYTKQANRIRSRFIRPTENSLHRALNAVSAAKYHARMRMGSGSRSGVGTPMMRGRASGSLSGSGNSSSESTFRKTKYGITPTYTPGGRYGIGAVGLADHYDYVLNFLLDEGYANTEDGALAIMSNMSEEWIQSILRE